MTKFLLDSGDPEEYKEISNLAKAHGNELWGATTNPSLIAKKLTGKKATQEEAFFVLQRQIIEEILQIVPGSVSGEVYAAPNTTAQEMIDQGKQIATWDPRVTVKLPTTLEGFKARTELRKLGICINNTLVFSQQQSYAITLHEKLMIDSFGKPKADWPSFISPFVGRLDDIGEDGFAMVSNSVETMEKYFPKDTTWMLEASIRSLDHMKKGIAMNVDLITAPAKIYTEWFNTNQNTTEQTANVNLKQLPLWEPSTELLAISSIDAFMDAISNGSLDITHQLTDKGIERFVSDWSQIIIQ